MHIHKAEKVSTLATLQHTMISTYQGIQMPKKRQRKVRCQNKARCEHKAGWTLDFDDWGWCLRLVVASHFQISFFVALVNLIQK